MEFVSLDSDVVITPPWYTIVFLIIVIFIFLTSSSLLLIAHVQKDVSGERSDLKQLLNCFLFCIKVKGVSTL